MDGNGESGSGREQLQVDVQGVRVAGACARPAGDGSGTLIAALHGGCYNGRYFDAAVPGSPSFMDLAAGAGHHVVSFDRPGYGASSAIAAGENTFERQAEVLTEAIGEVAQRLGAGAVVVVGHSIGGMIALTIAARERPFALLGVSATGMGAVIPPGGAAEGLAAVATSTGQEVIALPPQECDGVMLGPEGTWDPAILPSVHASYAPAPVVELVAAPVWATEKLPALAPQITTRVHNELAEFDALWDSSPENVAAFAALLVNAASVQAGQTPGVGHSIDHHREGAALHRRQLAFAEECAATAAAH